MNIDVIVWRDVKLESRLAVFEEQELDLLHLLPCRASVLPGGGNVIPTFANRSDDRDNLAIDRGRHTKHSRLMVSSRAVQTGGGSDVAKLVEAVEVLHSVTSTGLEA